jgi:hypothetical protein
MNEPYSFEFIYRETTAGNPVLGHKRRCETMAELLKRGNHKTDVVPYSMTRFRNFYEYHAAPDFVIVDGIDYLPKEHMALRGFIHILDEPYHMHGASPEDFIIAPGYGAEREEGFRAGHKGLFGLEGFPRHPHIDSYRKIGYSDGKHILLAPGGNHDAFWDTVGTFNVAGEAACILREVSHEQALALIANAKFVITAAGVTAIESVLLGKPTLLVKTSEDQSNYEPMLDDGVAFPYTYGMAQVLSSDTEIRNRMTVWNLEQTQKYIHSSFYSNFMGMIRAYFEDRNRYSVDTKNMV